MENRLAPGGVGPKPKLRNHWKLVLEHRSGNRSALRPTPSGKPEAVTVTAEDYEMWPLARRLLRRAPAEDEPKNVSTPHRCWSLWPSSCPSRQVGIPLDRTLGFGSRDVAEAASPLVSVLRWFSIRPEPEWLSTGTPESQSFHFPAASRS